MFARYFSVMNYTRKNQRFLPSLVYIIIFQLITWINLETYYLDSLSLDFLIFEMRDELSYIKHPKCLALCRCSVNVKKKKNTYRCFLILLRENKKNILGENIESKCVGIFIYLKLLFL